MIIVIYYTEYLFIIIFLIDGRGKIIDRNIELRLWYSEYNVTSNRIIYLNYSELIIVIIIINRFIILFDYEVEEEARILISVNVRGCIIYAENNSIINRI